MSEDWPRHGVVILAAGASTRLGQAKQMLVHRGETLVRRATRLALTTRPHDAAIVLGHRADVIFPQVEDLPARRVDCPDWRLGLGASLCAGVAALALPCAGVLVVLCDQPSLDEAHLLALCQTWRHNPERGVVSRYGGRLGAPALLPRGWFDALDARADRGMRDLIARWKNRIDAILDESLAVDIDSPEDLRHLRQTRHDEEAPGQPMPRGD